jgi:putative hydrolase of HD superfamily
MYREALIKIKNIKLHCVDYFLDHILPDMVNEAPNSPVDIRKITKEALSS